MAEAQLEAGHALLSSQTHFRHPCLLHSVELYIMVYYGSCSDFFFMLGFHASLPEPAFWTALRCLSYVFCCRNKGLEGTAGEGLDNRAAVGAVLENAAAFDL